jgi:transposase
VETLLEDTGIKLSVVASDIFGVSGRAIMAALIAGERDPEVLAQMARGSMRTKIARLEDAFNGHFGDHHRFLLTRMLARIDGIDADIAALDEQIETYLGPFATAAARLDEIPGIGPIAAAAIIAEVGWTCRASRLPGTCVPGPSSPGAAQFCRQDKGQCILRACQPLPGPHPRRAAVIAGNTFLGERYRRIAKRRGKQRANVAVGRSILVVIWHLLANQDTRFIDRGPDHFTTHLNAEAQPHSRTRSPRLG